MWTLIYSSVYIITYIIGRHYVGHDGQQQPKYNGCFIFSPLPFIKFMYTNTIDKSVIQWLNYGEKKGL